MLALRIQPGKNAEIMRPTHELVVYEDLGFNPRGRAKEAIDSVWSKRSKNGARVLSSLGEFETGIKAIRGNARNWNLVLRGGRK
jgi:hypothetical protein